MLSYDRTSPKANWNKNILMAVRKPGELRYDQPSLKTQFESPSAYNVKEKYFQT